MNYEKKPENIEVTSMSIIDHQLTNGSFKEEELPIVRRMIHASGDIAYQDIINIKPGAVSIGREAIKRGCSIVTDTKMALAGINKKALTTLGCSIDNYVDHPTVVQEAREYRITRSMAAVNFVADQNIDIFVVGNAPTALFRIGELIQANKIKPMLVIGVPVGFVGAAESKEYIRTVDVPSISTIGTKGGSNIAAAVLNALLYMETT